MWNLLWNNTDDVTPLPVIGCLLSREYSNLATTKSEALRHQYGIFSGGSWDSCPPPRGLPRFNPKRLEKCAIVKHQSCQPKPIAVETVDSNRTLYRFTFCDFRCPLKCNSFLFYQTMFSVHDQRVLGSQLLRIVGQRLAYAILDASESAERANRLSRLPTQISSWIKSQVLWKIVQLL